MKFHPLHPPYMVYKRCKFGSDRSLIKGTLLEEQSSFWLFLVVLLRNFPENSYSPYTLITSVVIFSVSCHPLEGFA